jgi:hypothetical protein
MTAGYRGPVTSTLDTVAVDPRIPELEQRVRQLERAEWNRYLNRWTVLYSLTMFVLGAAFFFALLAIERSP